MTNCGALRTCLFFTDKMEGLPVAADIFKKKYCQGDHSSCARHMVIQSLGKKKVPGDLFPNQNERAREIITAG